MEPLIRTKVPGTQRRHKLARVRPAWPWPPASRSRRGGDLAGRLTDSSAQRAHIRPCRVALRPRRDPMLVVADTPSRELGNRAQAGPGALWLCPPVRRRMRDKFRRNIPSVGRDWKPRLSKAKVCIVALGRLLPPKVGNHLGLAEPPGVSDLGEDLSSRLIF